MPAWGCSAIPPAARSSSCSLDARAQSASWPDGCRSAGRPCPNTCACSKTAAWLSTEPRARAGSTGSTRMESPPCAPTWTASGTTRSRLFRRPPRRPPTTANRSNYEHSDDPHGMADDHGGRSGRAGVPRLHRVVQQLVVTWQINGEWQYDPDPRRASEVEVRFTPDGPGQTMVELEHRLLERLVGGQAVHDGIGGEGGWTRTLERFAKAVVSQD